MYGDYSHLTNEELINGIKKNHMFNFMMAGELCRRAGLRNEWNAGVENFANLAEKAANKLGGSIRVIGGGYNEII